MFSLSLATFILRFSIHVYARINHDYQKWILTLENNLLKHAIEIYTDISSTSYTPHALSPLEESRFHPDEDARSAICTLALNEAFLPVNIENAFEIANCKSVDFAFLAQPLIRDKHANFWDFLPENVYVGSHLVKVDKEQLCKVLSIGSDHDLCEERPRVWFLLYGIMIFLAELLSLF